MIDIFLNHLSHGPQVGGGQGNRDEEERDWEVERKRHKNGEKGGREVGRRKKKKS